MKKEIKKNNTRNANKNKNNETYKKLVIVESPSKAQTIKKYLGKDFEVKASVGHLIDLPKSRMGVDLETFEPSYIILRDKYNIIKELREASKNAREIFLASDPDREGEAIAWHIKNDLEKNVISKIKDREIPIRRVKFNEITEREIKEKINSPDDIDVNLVEAQQSRRIIDRIFGYKLSPLLWEKVKSKLSAGRVQSVALRLICEREKEIENFTPQEYWNIVVTYELIKDSSIRFDAILTQIDGKKAEIKSSEEAEKIENALHTSPSVVKDVKKKNIQRNPQPPFITSTLQQAANTIYGFSSMKTMQIAQQLYEGVNLGETRTGLITYIRTDSVRVSELAINEVRNYIAYTMGKDYLSPQARIYKNKQAAQDAHEAIRPTNVKYTPQEISQYLTPDQYKLYSLIWKRFVASQMAESISQQTSIEIECGNMILTATSSNLVFDGFLRVYDFSLPKSEKVLPEGILPSDSLKLLKVKKEQKFTEPPPRYTEASLVKTMEELGIGRPSTYAPTIYTLTKRHYIKKEKKTLIPTLLGMKVNEILTEFFPTLINTEFTSSMENELDKVEEGKKNWKIVVKEFYDTLLPVLDKAYKEMQSLKGTLDEITKYKCEICGKPMVKKYGKYGEFLACSGWPECKNTKPIPLGKCPECKIGNIIKRKSKNGKTFYGCDRFPECNFTTFSLKNIKEV